MKPIGITLIFAIILLGINLNSFSQNKNSDIKKDFEIADGYLFEDNYAAALPILEKVFKTDSTNHNVQFLIGLCYLNLPLQKQKSIPYLEIAAKNINPSYEEGFYKERQAPLIALFYLADAYHYNYEFDKAIETYKKYISMLDKELDVEAINEVNHRIVWCDNAKLIVKDTVDIAIENLGDKINSPYPDYSPVLTADESTIIYTSRRPNSTGGETTADGLYYEDILIAKKDNSGKWQAPQPIGTSINTIGHEATLCLSADGQTLLIYKDDGGDGNLYISKLLGAEWTIPVKLGSNINTEAWETSASLSHDGNMLYFTSNRQGGFGGRDIYYCKKLPNGEWSKAMILPDEINTPYEEESPYIHPDGKTLFFSSKGHNSMGDFDIFISRLNDDGTWTEPQNLGFPINTTGNDVFYMPSLDGRRGYYASYQENGYGEKDIYMMTLPETHIVPLSVFKGNLKVEACDITLKNATIMVTNKETNEMVGIYKPNSSTGKYLMILNQGQEYDVVYETEGAYIKHAVLDVPLMKEQMEITGNVVLQPIRKNEIYTFTGSIFAKNSTTLTNAGLGKIEKVIRMLENNNTLKIKIRAYADNNDKNAKKISEDRARQVYGIMLEAGIDKGKLELEGMGYVKGKRDVEFKIVEINEEVTKLVEACYQETMIYDSTDTEHFQELAESKIIIDTVSDEIAENNAYVLKQEVNVETVSDNKNGKAEEKESVERKQKYVIDDKEMLIIRNVFFDFDKYYLKESDKYELDKLIKILKTHDNLMVTLIGHTDSKGSLEYNIALSRNRVIAVKQYLTNNGISQYRIEIEYKGETNPVAINKDDKGKDSPEGRKYNRRVEIDLLNTSSYNIKVKKEFEIPSNLRYK